MTKVKASTGKGIKPPKTAHTSNSKKGMGDYYGSGVVNKTGRMIEGMGRPTLTKKQIGKPPKSLA